MQRIGGMKGVLGMLPGVGKIKNAIDQAAGRRKDLPASRR